MAVSNEQTVALPLPAAWEGHRGEIWVLLQGGLLVVFLCLPGTGRAWRPWQRRLARPVGWALAAAGASLAVSGGLVLGRNLTPFPRPAKGAPLVEHGPYRLVRHPLYGGLTLGAVGVALLRSDSRRLLLAAAIFAFFNAKADREERWLMAQFPSYTAWANDSRKLLPGIY